MDPQIITVETVVPARGDVAAYDLGGFCRSHSISRGSALKEIRAGRLRVIRYGKKILVTKAAAEDWLRQLEAV